MKSLFVTVPMPEPTVVREETLDSLWREAETLGLVRVWPQSGWNEYVCTGYKVTLVGKVRNTKMEVERSHSSLHCALADAINEARTMGMGRTR